MQSVLSSATQHVSNENNVAKTPARNVSSTTKHPRRALGDISNRKIVQQQATLQNYDSSIHKTPKKGLTVSTSTGTVTKPQEVQLRNNTTTTNQQILSNSFQSLSLRTTTKRNNNVSFILPDNDKKGVAEAPPPPSQITTTSTSVPNPVTGNSKASSLFFPVNGIWNDHDDENEIEVPAGRLYKDQLLYDDDASSDELSIEGAKTVRQDYIDMFMEIHNDKIQQKELYIQQCIQSLDNISIHDDFDHEYRNTVVDDSFENQHHSSFSFCIDENNTTDDELCAILIDFPTE